MATLAERLQKAQEAAAQQEGTLVERLRAATQQRLMDTPTSGGTLGQTALNTFLNNFIPGAGNLLAALGAGAESGVAMMQGEPARFTERFAQQKQQFPASALRALTVQNLAAGMRSAPALLPGGESPGESFARNRADIAQEEALSREANPTAARAGEIVGDVATIASMRLPVARGINRAETALAPARTDLLFGSAVPQRVVDSNLKFILDRTIKSPAMRKLARGAGRSAETGLEAAVLDVLKGDDPLETAVYAAAGQAGGSLFIDGWKKILSGGPLKAGGKLGLAAFSIGSLWQILQSATPGGRDFILESMETGFNRVTWAMALGAMSGLVGAGRLRGGELAERFPKVTDAIATTPRAATISILEDLADADEDTQRRIELVLSKVMENPDYFGQTATRRMNRAFQNGSLVPEIEKLMDSREFRERLAKLENPSRMRTGGGF